METSQSLIKIIIYVILIVGIFFWFKNKGKSKSQLGINLKQVYCPVCQTKQPIIRMPSNQRQYMVGGTTCPKCKTDLDKYGDIIS